MPSRWTRSNLRVGFLLVGSLLAVILLQRIYATVGQSAGRKAHISAQSGLEQSAKAYTAGSLAAHVRAYSEVLDGTEVLLLNTTKPKAVLLVFHGCSHSATDWWFGSDTCQTCSGLPEEVAITLKALNRHWAVLAFSSSDRTRYRCWDSNFPPENSVDTLQVIRTFHTVATREGWPQDLPRYALGGSSGGAFLLHLALRLELTALCSQLMAVRSASLESPPHALGASEQGWTYPPAAFVHMARDKHTVAAVEQNMAVLKKQGVKTMQIIVQPTPLTPTFMAERVDGITLEQSKAVFEALREGDALDESGWLRADPRTTGAASYVSMLHIDPRRQQAAANGQAAVADALPASAPSCTDGQQAKGIKCWVSRLHMAYTSWRSLVRSRLPEANVAADESAIAEELNVAWASHELVRDPMDEVFDWMEAQRVPVKHGKPLT
ncbi:hypothetical protein WJX73_002960 [Symbiochloris irregularis]|uniref:Uncharacterized protein n=1 Tax=Symbiochloris irregularis TaxID=706552 RepID=A0AAW1NVC9_9CHLO